MSYFVSLGVCTIFWKMHPPSFNKLPFLFLHPALRSSVATRSQPRAWQRFAWGMFGVVLQAACVVVLPVAVVPEGLCPRVSSHRGRQGHIPGTHFLHVLPTQSADCCCLLSCFRVGF